MADKQTVEYNYYPISLAVSEIDKNVASNSPAVPLSGENIATVGGASILQSNYMQSTNYSKGNSGWRINAAGDVEFGNGYFRGDITGASGTFTGTLSAATVLYGKTSFADTAAGYIISPLGVYIGALNDTTRLKYTVSDGSIDFIGSHSSGSIGGVATSYVVQIATSTADIVPTGFAISETGITSAIDGTQTAYVTLTWTAISSDTFNSYKIRYKKNSFTYYTYINSTENTVTIEGLTPNTSYNFGIASVNKFGTESAFTDNITSDTASTTVAPATVTAGSANAGIQYVVLEWTHNTEPDLASYNIYRHTSNTSGSATLIGNCRTDYFVDGGLTGGQIYYYWIKAINTSGIVSTAFSTVKSATPRNVEDTDVTQIAGDKILIDGAVYLSNWRKTGDVTKIDGGSISANTIATTQLNFTPVQGTDVIASINASAEGIAIDADNLTINAATTFGSGYDPADKVDEVGGAYDSAASGARVRIFPDANTGIQIIDDAAGDVFKAEVGGANVGDITIGNATKYVKWDKSAASLIIVADDVTLNGSSLAFQNIYGDGSDNDLTVSSNTTLTADAYYDNLTINTGITLNPNGYKIFVSGVLTFVGTGKIIANGGDGGNGATITAGAAGTRANTEGTLPESGAAGAGGDGFQASAGVPYAGAAGQSFERSCNVDSAASGAGGNGAGAGAAAGAVGANTETRQNPLSTLNDIYGMMSYSTDTYARLSSACSPGGGGGGGAGNGAGVYGYGGGGGGGGAPGGIIMVLAKNIVTVDGNTYAEANGGDGGDGGDGNRSQAGTSAGGGGAGAGGHGGVVFIIYSIKTGTGTISTTAGTGGTGGAGGDDALGATPGDDGEDGGDGTAGFNKLLII